MPQAQSQTSPSDRPDLPWNGSLPETAQLTLDIQRLCRDGEADPVGVILGRYPELHADRMLVLDLIFEEYLERKKAGGAVDAEAFCRRFPGYERSLRDWLIVQNFVEENLARVSDDDNPVPRLVAGQQILGFYVLQELGRGGFAQVLLASEPALGNRLVAIKISSEGLAEARTLGRLNHPNIVPVFSVQEEPVSGLSVVCMPYLGTATLNDVLDRLCERNELPQRAAAILQTLPGDARPTTSAPSRALSHEGGEGTERRAAYVLRRGTYIDGVLHLAIQITEALEFIHSRGICHRDLKPSNILMTPDGRPMLLDFNLSLNKPPSSDLSPSPSPNRRGPTCGPAGTPLYMPPEQLLALDPNNRSDHPCLIDERSDLYSLGVILYELLTGLHPSHPIPLGLPLPKLIPLMLAGQKKGIRPIRQLNPRVDKALAEAIERCLANDPRDRPHSATELLAVLRRQLSPFRRARRWAASHATLLCAAVLLGLATASAGIYFSVPKEPYSIRRLNQGLDRYRQGRFEEAILSLNQAIEADPASVEARFARARAFQQLDHIESALADFEKADDLANQQDGRIKACLGYCSNLLAIHDRAIENYQRARELNFVNAELCNNLGYSYLQWRSPLLKANDSVSRAQHCFDEAIKLDDGLQPAYYNRAILDIQKIAANPQKIPLQGLVDIRKAIELGPPSAPLFLDAARLCVLASKSDPTLLPESLGYLEKAIELGLSANNVKMDFLFAGLRSDPRFQTVLNKPPCSERFQSPQRLVDPVKE